jgi:dolichol kinase
MNFVDVIVIISVYVYVIAIFFISEKVLKTRPEVSRKFLHIMVGNMIFAMPFFSEPWIMIVLLTLPASIGTFLLTEYSPIKIDNSVTESGHALGLFFYSAIWTVLILVFSDYLWIVALAIVPMVYGDGFAALIGQKFGRVKFHVFGGVKSLEGSLTMFVITTVMSVFVWMVFATIGYPMPDFNLGAILAISAVATICEAISYGGIDNLTVPAVTSVLYYLVTIL